MLVFLCLIAVVVSLPEKEIDQQYERDGKKEIEFPSESEYKMEIDQRSEDDENVHESEERIVASDLTPTILVPGLGGSIVQGRNKLSQQVHRIWMNTIQGLITCPLIFLFLKFASSPAYSNSLTAEKTTFEGLTSQWDEATQTTINLQHDTVSLLSSYHFSHNKSIVTPSFQLTNPHKPSLIPPSGRHHHPRS
jgi:hypothetical protein